MWLFLLFVIVPIVEIALFIQVGGFIGLWPTLGIVVLTAFAGTSLLRMQGMATLQRLQNSMRDGQDPVDPMIHGALILVAGVLLLTPGFFTDAVGLSLMVPMVRAAVIRWGAARMLAGGVTIVRPGAPQQQPQQPTDIDGAFTVVDDDAPRGNSGWRRDDD